MKKIARIAIPMIAISTFSSIATTAFAAESLPAVSGLNGKVDAYIGNFDGESNGVVLGSLTMPVGKHLGVQFDVMQGRASGDDQQGIAAHGFWRNPEQGLIGLTAALYEQNDVEVEQFGVEAEWYTKDFTFAGGVAERSGDIDSSTVSNIGLSYYLHDDLAVSLTGDFTDEENLAGLGVEYQTPASGFTVYANTERSDEDTDRNTFGFRYYFGEQKSLKRRHREDDPQNFLPRMASASQVAIEKELVRRELNQLNSILLESGLDLDTLLGELGLEGLNELLETIGLDPVLELVEDVAGVLVGDGGLVSDPLTAVGELLSGAIGGFLPG